MNALVLENRHTGERLELRRLRRNAEVWLELKGTLPPRRQGPPMHIHFAEDEVGHIIAGTLSASVNGQVVTVPAGASTTLPRGLPHRWWNDGDELLVFEGYAKPVVDLDRYLQAMFEVLNAGPDGRPPLFYMAHAAIRHRETQALLLMPGPLQALLFRTVVAIGTVLGKYRGEDWPGCPSRCTGASIAAEGVPQAT